MVNHNNRALVPYDQRVVDLRISNRGYDDRVDLTHLLNNFYEYIKKSKDVPGKDLYVVRPLFPNNNTWSDATFIELFNNSSMFYNIKNRFKNRIFNCLKIEF